MYIYLMGSLRNLQTQAVFDQKRQLILKQEKEALELAQIKFEEACFNNNPALVREALAQGADPNKPPKNISAYVYEDDTALGWCYGHCSNKVIHAIISCPRFDPDLEDHHGRGPLNLAVSESHYGVIRRLLKLKADPITRSEELISALEQVQYIVKNPSGTPHSQRRWKLCEKLLLKALENKET